MVSRSGRVPVTNGLPEGFALVERGGWSIAVRESARGAVLDATVGGPDVLAGTGEARYAGRGRPVRIVLPDGTPGVLRRYLHGGLLRKVAGSWFLGPSRPFRELRATERARRAGVSVPEVLAAWRRPRAGVFHEGWLLTREVPAARDLPAVLADGARIPAAFSAIGREVRRLHEAGVVHGDLHVKNVLVGATGVTILDFDRARIVDPAPRSLCVGNLLRFDRSVEKLTLSGPVVPRADRLRVFAAYFAEGLSADERRRIARRCRRSLSRHRLGWRLLGAAR